MEGGGGTSGGTSAYLLLYIVHVNYFVPSQCRNLTVFFYTRDGTTLCLNSYNSDQRVLVCVQNFNKIRYGDIVINHFKVESIEESGEQCTIVVA